MLWVCAIVRPIAEEKGLELVTVLPAHDGRYGHAPAIARILLNLTTNALKFTEHGSVTIGCSELSDTDVEFWVSDTGSGIPEAVQETLLEPAPRTRYSSPGLGLTICRTLLDAIGGSLDFSTAPGIGTRFAVRLALPRADW
jgi:signal transduction histidine kinase